MLRKQLVPQALDLYMLLLYTLHRYRRDDESSGDLW
jgi:hypothetical protein